MNFKSFFSFTLFFLCMIYSSIFSMYDSHHLIFEQVKNDIQQNFNNSTIREFQDNLSDLLRQISYDHYDLEHFLLIMNSRVKLMQGMFFESCACNAFVADGLSHDDFANCYSLKKSLIEQNLDLYTSAEILYSEASSMVQQAIDALELLANNIQLVAYKNTPMTIKRLFSYQNIRSLFTSRFLQKERPDFYKEFLFHYECIEEVERVLLLYGLFLEADCYKDYLKSIYDQMYEVYINTSSGAVNKEIKPTIFALDDAINFVASYDERARFCDFLRLIRLCKVKDLMIAQKSLGEMELKEISSKRINNIRQRLANKARIGKITQGLTTISELDALEMNGGNRFTHDQCLALIPQLFNNYNSQVQEELLMIVDADRELKGIKPCGLTALSAYFNVAAYIINSENFCYSFALDSDVELHIKDRILDSKACREFIQEIEETLNTLIPSMPALVQPLIPEKIFNKSKKRKNSKKKLTNKNKNKFKKLVLREGKEEKSSFSQICTELDIVTPSLNSVTIKDVSATKSAMSPIRLPVQDNDFEAQEDVEQVALGSDHILSEDIALICLLDCQRAAQGGYQIEVFVYKNNEQHLVNPLETLDYSALSKINNPKDNNHAFTKLVEVYGSYGRFESVEELAEEDFEYSNGYRFKCFISLKGRLASLGYPIDRASKCGPNGVFEFTVLKRDKNDKDGICIHRFFRPNR